MSQVSRRSNHLKGTGTKGPVRPVLTRVAQAGGGARLAVVAFVVVCFALAGSTTGAVSLSRASGTTPTPTPPRMPSPAKHLLPSGRLLTPQGSQVGLGNLPSGGALTADGRLLWTVSAGFGDNDVRIVDTLSHRVCQVLPLPGASGGIALDSPHQLAYVSGLANSRWEPSKNVLPGAAGNDILVYSWASGCGRVRLLRVIPVPAPPGAPLLQEYPPTQQRSTGPGAKNSWPQQLAISPDGGSLLVPLNLADHAAVIDLLRSDQVRYVPMGIGSYPFGAAVLPGGRTGLVTNEATGILAVVDLRRGTKYAGIAVGPPLSHPQGVVVDRAGRRAYVALSSSDQVVVVDLRHWRVERTISVGRLAGLGTMPVALALEPSEKRLFVAESGADEIAVVNLPSGASRSAPAWRVIGRIPTASQPEVVTIAAANGSTPARLVWIAARAFDVGANSGGPNPLLAYDPIFWAFNPVAPTFDIFNSGVTYVPNLLGGNAGILPLPSNAAIRKLTPVASRQLNPVDAAKAPANTPLRAGGPIKHVFFLVRENRSYDQVLGDDARGNGDPKLNVFDGTVTPNMHALVKRFPLLDNTYANSDASIQGHYLTAASIVPDYVSRNWVHNYAGRGRPSDFGMYAVTWPGNGFLFDQAERQHISYFNYGEQVGGGDDSVPDRNRSAAQLREVTRVANHSDLGPQLTPGGCFPAAVTIGTAIDGNEMFDGTLPPGAPAGSYSHVDCFRARFAAQLAKGSVPTMNYIALTSDHTRGTQVGFPTPSAMIADSDQALGQLVDTISHSSVWRSSAIFVVEDDSQDGADHVDGHRIPALVISPYARRGAVIHSRYDVPSVLRSMELTMGMNPLSLNDALATPMYDVFAPTAVNSAPVTNIPAQIDLLSRNTATSPGAALSGRLPLGEVDQVRQGTLDRILWMSVHGAKSTPPPPGPNSENDD